MKKVLLAVLALASVVTAAVIGDDDEPEYVPGIPVRSLRAVTDLDPVNCVGTVYDTQCADCYNIKLCYGVQAPTDIKNCGVISPSTPYCAPATGTCSATRPDVCTSAVQGTSNLQCTSEGWFPDPTDCGSFYYCSAAPGGVGLAAAKYMCPGVNVYAYDPTTSMCKKRRVAADCALMSCPANFVGRVVYSLDKSIYRVCFPSSQTTYIILHQCPDKLYQQYNLATGQCAFVCPKEGNFPDNNYNCGMFISCYLDSTNKLVSTAQSCPAGLYFDITKTPNCQKLSGAPCVPARIP